MSNALAIAGVSAVLQSFLGNVYTGLSALFGGNVTISAKAPDIVQEGFGNGTTPQNQVNLFLHQVTHNSGWRNQRLPSLGADGKTALGNPPLALDLHYLLTAYGSDDWQAEALLGLALLMLHENPVLTRSDISNTIATLPGSNPLSTALGSSGLADQIEMLKITPATLGREEMAWLWTALKADYRPTFPFQVSVVLIEPPNTTVSPLPVLRRSIAAQPNLLSPFPTLIAVECARRTASRLFGRHGNRSRRQPRRRQCRPAEQFAARNSADHHSANQRRKYVVSIYGQSHPVGCTCCRHLRLVRTSIFRNRYVELQQSALRDRAQTQCCQRAHELGSRLVSQRNCPLHTLPASQPAGVPADRRATGAG